MIDVFAQYSLLAIGIILFICLFAFKHKVISFVGGFVWAYLAWSLFNFYYNDADTNMTSFGLAYASVIMAIIMFSSVIWITPKEKEVEKPIDSREDWEIEDEQREKKLKYLRRYRPKGIYHGTKH